MLLFNNILRNIKPTDLKTNKGCPFTMTKNSTKFDKHSCEGYL